MGSRLRRAALLPTVAVALVLGACTRPDLLDDTAGDQASTELRWRPAGDAVVCDGTERPAGTIEQAEAGETIEFATALPVDVAAGTADDDGQHVLVWTCGPEEAHLRWDLTATGARSGGTVRLTVVGAPAPADERALDATLYRDTVVCDGTSQEAGVIDGLSPGERVRFAADQDGAAADPKARDDGTLPFGWRCRPGDVGRTWQVTVTAVDSDRTTTFQLGGDPPADDLPLEVESAVTEIACDGRVLPLATIVNLFPFEEVAFTSSPSASDLRGGSADGAGRLDLRWQCDPADVGTTWNLTAEAAETGKTIAVRFVGIAGQPVPAATVRVVEDPFVCDGERRVVAELGGLDAGEFVDFTSPQAGPLLEGRSSSGRLEVNWQCDATDLDGAETATWAVTATGRESGRAVTFEIVGVLRP